MALKISDVSGKSNVFFENIFLMQDKVQSESKQKTKNKS